MADPQTLLAAVREACPDGFWARGVKLARGGRVVGKTSADDEVVLQVAVPNAPAAFTVHLWPEEEDWACDCPSQHDACAHVAAGVIAWHQASQNGEPIPQAGSVSTRRANALGTVGYRLQRADRGWRVERKRVRGLSEQPLNGALRGRGGKDIITTQADLEVEEALSHRFGTVIGREVVPIVLRALAECTDITLDGDRIRISRRLVVPIGRVEDARDETGGFRLRIVRDPDISEVFHNGSVLCTANDGGPPELRPVGDGGLSRQQRTVLGRGVVFTPEEVGKLVAEALPALRKMVPVDVRTRRLPDVDQSKPRLVLKSTAQSERLVVQADIVYGDPPSARVKHGELELLGGAVPIRDERSESRLARTASEQLGLPIGLEKALSGEGAVRFVERMSGYHGAKEGDAWRRFRRAPTPQPQIRLDGDKLHIDLDGADPLRMVKAWVDGASLFPVADGWAPIPREWLEQYGHLVADLLASRDPEGRVPTHALLDLARLAKVLNQPPPPQLEGLRPLLEDFEGIPPAPLPDDLDATLRTYQVAGIDWLGFLSRAGLGGILADDMGLGKTIQALCALRGRAIVIVPTSVLHNWVNEAARFRPGLLVKVYHGTTRKLDPQADLTVTTYGLLRNDIDELSKIEWGTAILDEAQAIKNPESLTAQAAYRLKAHFRLTLTGTPIENRLDELWSQFHFLMPGLLGGRRDFRERYEKPINMGDNTVVAHMRKRIRPFVLRRLKREVAPELPPRTDIVMRATLSPDERNLYDAVRAASREAIVRELGEGGNVLKALEALLRLRQAACHPALLPGRTAETSSKLKLLIETLDEVVAEGHKALVFSQWTSMLNLIEPHLAKAGIDHVRLDGSTRDRQGVVAQFQDDAGPPVFLISLKAGGLGLNLTAADHVFLVDPWWNPAAEDQAADRAHRIGQDKPVMVFRLVAENTVEERILKLQDRKRALAEAALGEGGAAAGGITRAELMALLE